MDPDKQIEAFNALLKALFTDAPKGGEVVLLDHSTKLVLHLSGEEHRLRSRAGYLV